MTTMTKKSHQKSRKRKQPLRVKRLKNQSSKKPREKERKVSLWKVMLEEISCLRVGNLMSVRLWNFKDGGCKNARFLPKNRHPHRKLFENNPTMNYGSSKSAKIVLSKSIFYIKNRRKFFKKKSFKNINLGDHFL